MPVDRKIFKAPFYRDSQVQWTCPTCNQGILKAKKDGFSFFETKKSLDEHKQRGWEPEEIEFIYTYQLICSNPSCEDSVVSIGSGSVDFDPAFDLEGQPNGIEYYEYFQPKLFMPHLNIFKIAQNTPEIIRSSIEESFKLFFVNPSSSANHIRIALEKLLDYLKVKKYETKKGKRLLVNLHKRIDLLPPKYANFKELYFAIKWLGNTGSHSDTIRIDDVMDAYDIFEIILEELFDNKTKKAKTIAKAIIKKKGRVKSSSFRL